MIQNHDVARLRSHMGLSQEKFAKKLGVSVFTVSTWERSLNKPRGLSLRALERLAKQLKRKDAKR